MSPLRGLARGGGSCRGVTYWEDGNDQRSLFTGGDKRFALNARTGEPIPAFGTNGKVSMNVGIRDDPEKISIKPTSPGIVFKDLLIIGNMTPGPKMPGNMQEVPTAGVE